MVFSHHKNALKLQLVSHDTQTLPNYYLMCLYTLANDTLNFFASFLGLTPIRYAILIIADLKLFILERYVAIIYLPFLTIFPVSNISDNPRGSFFSLAISSCFTLANNSLNWRSNKLFHIDCRKTFNFHLFTINLSCYGWTINTTSLAEPKIILVVFIP